MPLKMNVFFIYKKKKEKKMLFLIKWVYYNQYKSLLIKH